MGAPDVAITARMRAQTPSEGIDIGSGVAATIVPNADAPGHLQCGSYAPATPEISSSKIGWGGARPNSGGARENAGGARPNSGGTRIGAGRKPKSGTALANERIAASIGSLGKPAADGARWYCATVYPQLASVALGELVKQGFTAWLPRFQQLTPAGRVSRPPLFPGYVFVRFSLTYDPWWQINGTPGVRGLFPIAGEKPWPIPHAQMDTLFGDCDAEGVYTKTVVAKPGDMLEVGDNVLVVDGPFTGFPAKVLAAPGATVRLEITIFGRSSEVEHPIGMVEKAR